MPDPVILPDGFSNPVLSDTDRQPKNPAYLLPQHKDNDTLVDFDLKGYQPYADNLTAGSLYNEETRAAGQSGWEQAYHALNRSVAEVVGGSISGFGSLGAFFTDVLTEGGRQDADFSNSMMEFGDKVMKDAATRNPIYRENPGQSFDFSDPGYWWENVPSVASSLSLLIPSRAVSGGVGMLGRAVGLAGKVGKTASWLGDVALISVIARNGENMRESMGHAATAKEQTLEKTKDMTDTDFQSMLGSNDIGKDFLASGKEVTKENYAKFVGAQAGMTSYKSNAGNVVFDFIQTAIAYKALSGLTRSRNLGNLFLGEESLAAARAEAALAGRTVSLGQVAKIATKNALKYSLAGITEGVEEINNSIGEKEANRTTQMALNEPYNKGGVASRVGEYLNDSHVWDAGFWGYFGGKAFEGGAHLLEKVANSNRARGMKEDPRGEEIARREQVTTQLAKDLQEVDKAEKEGTMSSEAAEVVRTKIGQDAAFHMGVNAAQSGQVDNLLRMVQSPDFEAMLTKNMTAEEQQDHTPEKSGRVRSTIEETIRAAERVYRQHSNRILNSKEDDAVKNYLMSQAVSTGYDTYQRTKKGADLQQQYEALMGDPNFSNQASNPNFRDSIDLAAYQELRNTYQQTLSKFGDNQIAAKRLLQKGVDNINTEIEAIRLRSGENLVELTDRHEALITNRYQQLANNAQIDTNKTILDDIDSEETVKTAKTNIEQAKAKRRSETKKKYEEAISSARASQTAPEVPLQEIVDFGDEGLIAKYNRLVKEQEAQANAAQQVSQTQEEALPVNETEVSSPEQVDEEPASLETPARETAYADLGRATNPARAARVRKLEEEIAKAATPELAKEKYNKLVALLLGLEGVVEGSHILLYLQAKYGEQEPTMVVETGEPPVVVTDPTIIEELVSPLEETLPEEVAISEPELSGAIPTDVVEPEEQPIQLPSDLPLVVDGDASLFVLNLHNAGRDATIIKKEEGHYVPKNATVADGIKALRDVRRGTEVELFVDTTNPFHKDTEQEAAIGVRIDGKTLFYLNTEASIRNEIVRSRQDTNPVFITRLQNNLSATIQFRKEVWAKKEGVKANITGISSGTVIPGPRSNPLEVVAGSWRLGFVDPSIPGQISLKAIGESEAYDSSLTPDLYNSDGLYTSGVEYLLVEGFNFDGSLASRTPLRLHRANLSHEDAGTVYGVIEEIVDRMNNGAKLNSEEIAELRDRIANLTAVNKSNQEVSTVNGQQVVSVPKPYFKVHSNRIEFLFKNGTELATIWFKDKRSGTTKVDVHEWKGKKAVYDTDAEYLAQKGSLITNVPKDSSKFQEVIMEALATKPYQVSYADLLNGKVTPEQLFSSGKVQADFGVIEYKGERISNFWAKPDKELVEGVERFQRGNLIVTLGTAPASIATQTEKPGKEEKTVIESTIPNEQLSTIYDDVQGITIDDGLPMLVEGEPIKTEVSKEERVTNFERMFGKNIPFDASIDNLIRFKGELAWGLFTEAGTQLVKGAPIGTEYHEAWHVTTQLYLTGEEINRSYDEGAKRYGEMLTRRQLDERLAEEFRAYANGQKRSGLSGWLQGLFDKLLYAIKNYLGKATNKDLFRAIYGGHFNFKPTARMLEFAGGLAMNEDPIYREFTSAEIRDYVDWATMSVARDLPLVQGKTNKEISENPNQYNLRLRAKARLAAFSQTADPVAKETIDRIASNWENDKGFWPLVVENVRRKLNYEVAFDETAPNDFEGTVQLQKNWDDRVPYGRSQKESFDFELKRVITLTPKLKDARATVLEDGTQVFRNLEDGNPAKLPVPVNFNEVYPMLATAMSDATTMEEMMNRLANLAEVEPSMAHLWSRVSSDPLLKQRWFTNFRKSFMPDLHIRFTPEENEGYSVRMDRANKIYGIADTWATEIQSQMSITNAQKVKTYGGRTSEELKRLEDIILRGVSPKNVSDYAKALGLDISPRTIEQVVFNKQLQEFHGMNQVGVLNILATDLRWIGNNIVKGLDAGALLTFTDRGNLNRLAQYVNYYMPDGVENSYVNTQGKVVFSLTKPSFISEFFDDIAAINNPFTVNKKAAKEKFLGRLKELGSERAMMFSNWLFNTEKEDGNGLLNLRENEKFTSDWTIEDLNIPFLKEFGLYKSGDVKEVLSGYGANYSELSDSDWDLNVLMSYIAGVKSSRKASYFPIEIQSDSGNIWTIRSRRYRLVRAGSGVDRSTQLFRALKATVGQERLRMEQASRLLFERGENLGLRPRRLSKEVKDSLIVGLHYKETAKSQVVVDGEVWYEAGDPITLSPNSAVHERVPTGRVFTFYNTNFEKDGKLVSVNDIPGMKLLGVYDRGAFTTETRLALEEHIAAFAENLMSQAVANYATYKGLVQRSQHQKGDKLLTNWSGDFDLAVQEMELNTYLTYVEHGNFFNGGAAEYKSARDMNKRAKQQTAPRQTTATTHRGEYYQAVILKDIEISSTYLDAIAKDAATQIAKQFKGLSETEIQKKVDKVVARYKKINVGDAQGFVTLDRLEATLKDYGRWNDEYEQLFKVARNPNLELSDEQLGTLMEVLKPFYYAREYDPLTGVVRSRQIKTSLLPLIPRLYKGSDLETLVSHLEGQGVGELYFESAVKVGQFKVSNVFDGTGKLKKDFQTSVTIGKYRNDAWGLQLDVPSHIKDEENKLGLQISKLAFANLSNEPIYEVGEQSLTGPEIRNLFQSTLSENVKQSSEDLMTRLGAKEDGTLDLEKVSEILKSEVRSRGLARNYEDAVDTVTSGKDSKFALPLSATNMAQKYMSILSSLFTSQVTNQKMPGGHAVIATSGLMNFDKVQGVEEIGALGIDFTTEAKSRIKDGKFRLRYRDLQNGSITHAEALMPSWSRDFFRDGQRISIDEVPVELRTMLGYRIPTEGKYSTVVFEVVGFLPESSGSTVILPYELVAQTGWDHDVDSLYMMQRTHKRVVNGKEASSWIAEKSGLDIKEVSRMINEIRRKTGMVVVPNEVRELYSTFASEQFDLVPVQSGQKTRDARNNTMLDIFMAIHDNPHSYLETFSGSNFDDALAVKKEVESLTGLKVDNINPFTRGGQDLFRKANIAGRALKGFAANANSALAIFQNVQARLREELGFKFKYDLTQYNENELRERYGESMSVEDGYAIINHTHLGHSPNGDFLNVNGDVTTNHAAQILAMVVDIVKEGFPYNVNTYTFNTFMAMIATGTTIRNAGLFVRQPILERLASRVLNNQSVLEDVREKEIHIIKKQYSASLYTTLYRAGKIAKEDVVKDGLWDKKENAILPLSVMKFRIGKKGMARLEPSKAVTAYSADELAEMIKMENKEFRSNLSNEKWEDYYRNQLNILSLWSEYFETGQAFSNAVGILSADKIGAGPDLRITPQFYERIARTEDNERRPAPVIGPNGQSIGDLIYGENSTYPLFSTYLRESNDKAFKALSPLFLETQPGYLQSKSYIAKHLKLAAGEDTDRLLDRFLGTILGDKYYSYFAKGAEARRVLGIGKEIGNYSDLSIEDFKALSAAEKLRYIRGLNVTGPFLERLIPKLEAELINKRQMHSILFSKPKPSDGIDDILVEDFNNLLSHNNEMVRLLMEDLIQYNYLTNGLSFGANNWGSYIPVDKQIAMGLGVETERMMSGINSDFLIDPGVFARNNWNRSTIVPIARTQYEYDDNGDRVKTTVENGMGYDEVDEVEYGFFNWDERVSNAMPLAVPKKNLQKERNAIKAAPYLLLKNREDTVLMKRMFLEDERDNPYSLDYPIVWYYPVGKLGSRFIGTETGPDSIIEANNVPISEEGFRAMIEGSADFRVLNQQYEDAKAKKVNCA